MKMRPTADSHPVMARLRHQIERSHGPVDVERAVVKHGRPFIGIERPEGYRQGKPRACFGNAATLALQDRGTYVEGFALSQGHLVHHAWIALDDVHAIDTTWPNAPDCHYLGVPFSTRTVSAWAMHHGGYALPLLSFTEPDCVCKLLSEAVGRGVITAEGGDG